MNIRHLEYIIAVSEHKSFIKAAEACYVSQPALSMQIKKLEDQLGVIIFERQHKQVLVTDAGKIILEKSKEIIQSVNDLTLLAKSLNEPLSGILKMGLFPTISQYILPDLLSLMQKKLPNLKLHPIEEKTPQIEAMLQSGQIDCAILAAPIDTKLFHFVSLFKDALYVALPKGHRLAKEKRISIDQLVEEPLLLLEDGHCLRTQTLAFCAQSDYPLNLERSATSLESLRHMVIASLGITVIPEIAIRFAPYQSKDIIYVPFEKPEPYREIGLVFRKSYSNQQLEETLTQLLIEHFK
ncbi:LysR substrate-binding domain-containing protein [Thiotrichales bacterium 19S11-10]|nr:LysR substrate-binding domain-containing protein [Thiotrichales bacterium 19S11-10]